MQTFKADEIKGGFTSEYIENAVNKNALEKRVTCFEKLCKIFGKIGFEPPKSLKSKLYMDLLLSGIRASPREVFSFAIYLFVIASIFASFLYFFSQDLGIFIFVLPFTIFYLILTYPAFIREVNRVQSGSNATKVILYMITYLKMNLTIESAIKLVSKNIDGPFGRDLKEISWGISSGKYRTVGHAIRFFVPKWMLLNKNFVKSFRMLLDVNNVKSKEERDIILRESLRYIVDGNLNEMESYMKQIKIPITILYMLNFLVMVLGLVVFSSISVFLHGLVKPGYVIIGYLILVPLVNLYIITKITARRPSLLFQSNASSIYSNLLSEKHKMTLSISKIIALAIILVIIAWLIIISYIIPRTIELNTSFSSLTNHLPVDENFMLFKSTILSLLFVLGFGCVIYIGMYLYKHREERVREKIKEIEDDLPNILLSISNVLIYDASSNVVIDENPNRYEYPGLDERVSDKFLSELQRRIKKYRISLERALFDEKYGVLNVYPSETLKETMRILLVTRKKNKMFLSSVLNNLSDGFKYIKKIRTTIKKLFNSTKVNLKVLFSVVFPCVSSVLSFLILTVLSVLSFDLITTKNNHMLSVGLVKCISVLFEAVPITTIQIVLGMYTFIIVILSGYLISFIENGFDEVMMSKEITDNIRVAMVVYFITTALCIGLLRVFSFI